MRTRRKGFCIAVATAATTLTAGAAVRPRPAEAPVATAAHPSPLRGARVQAAPARAGLIAGLLVPRRVRLIIRYTKVKIA